MGEKEVVRQAGETATLRSQTVWLDLITFILITGSAPLENLPSDPLLTGSIIRVCDWLELCGPTEWHGTEGNYGGSVSWARYAWGGSNSLPTLRWAELLPTAQQHQDARVAQKNYRAHLEGRQVYYQHTQQSQKSEEVGVWLTELTKLELTWETMARISDSKRSYLSRRGSLASLLYIVGEEAFAAARWPPAIPMWRMSTRTSK